MNIAEFDLFTKARKVLQEKSLSRAACNAPFNHIFQLLRFLSASIAVTDKSYYLNPSSL